MNATRPSRALGDVLGRVLLSVGALAILCHEKEYESDLAFKDGLKEFVEEYSHGNLSILFCVSRRRDLPFSSLFFVRSALWFVWILGQVPVREEPSIFI